MSMDKATVANVAHLARIRVEDSEVEGFAGELSGIMQWIDALAAVDVTEVPPMASAVDRRLPERPDAVTDGGDQARVLANAPETAHGYFLVPRVVE